MGVLAKEVSQHIHRDPFAHLAEHPANSLMHQVVWVVQMDLCIAQAPRGVALLRGLPRTDDTHALLPEIVAGSQFVEQMQFVVMMDAGILKREVRYEELLP